MSRVSQGTTLGPAVFNSFINCLDDVAECTIHKFAGDVKLGGLPNPTEGCAVIWRNLHRLERETDES